MSKPAEKLPGVRGEFTPVGRQTELNSFRDQVSRIKNLGSAFQTIWEFYGTPGIGKTTLLLLMEKECQELGVQHTKIDFDPKKSHPPDRYLDQTNIIEDLLVSLPDENKEQVKEKISVYREQKGKSNDIDDLNLKNVSRSFVKYMGDLSEKGPVVMFFDSAEQKDKLAGEWLEEWVLNPLSQDGKILTVWASRRPEKWKRFELRRRVIGEGIELPELDLDAVNEQFYNQIQTKETGAMDLYQNMQSVVFGHPLANQIIIDTINQWAKTNITFEPESLADRQQELIRILKEQFIDGYVFERVNNGRIVKRALEIMSLVRQFDATLLSGILSSEEGFKSMQREDFGMLLSLLVQSQLVVWDEQRKNYAVDSNIKEILRLSLLQDNPQAFIAFQEKAIKFYNKNIEKAGMNKYLYIIEKLYHLANLKQVGEQANLEDALKQELDDIILSENDIFLGREHLDRLFHFFETDIELQGLLEENEFERLKQLIIKKIRNPEEKLTS